jgi:hypothetical protein
MAVNEITRLYNELLAEKVLVAMRKRGFEGSYRATRVQALERALSLIPEEGVSSFGGSETLREIDLRGALKEAGRRFLDPDEGSGGDEKSFIALQAQQCDCYFMSTNAITFDGELVNVDGIGNRVAALSFGPKRVVVIAGMNKLTPDRETAILRLRTVAAPKTVLLFKKDYTYFDDLVTDATNAAAQLVITERSVLPGRVHVVLVGEPLGH